MANQKDLGGKEEILIVKSPPDRINQVRQSIERLRSRSLSSDVGIVEFEIVCDKIKVLERELYELSNPAEFRCIYGDPMCTIGINVLLALPLNRGGGGTHYQCKSGYSL